jgi:hypothetical protein
MPDHLKQLTAIQKQREKLHEREATLIEKRKTAIATLAEQFNLLTVDDKILSNYFAHFKEFLNESFPKAPNDSRNHSSTKSEIREA